MDKIDVTLKENSITVLNIISKIVQDIERNALICNIRVKECNELKVLKEKCCNDNATVAATAFHGILSLVEKKFLTKLQTISMLISLLPSISQYGPLVSVIGNILKLDLQSQISEKGAYHCSYTVELQHPFIMILKHNKEKSWCEIYNFVLQLLEANENIKCEHKIKFLRPIFRHLFWSSSWRGTQIQLKLFDALLMEMERKEYNHFILEVLMWQEMDINYCLFLHDLVIELLKKKPPDYKLIISALTPMLAQAIKWLIVAGHNPTVWIKILMSCIEIDNSASSSVLYILSDVIMETTSMHINSVIDVCKSIILGTSCGKYVAYKFIAIILNWFINPSTLVSPLYKTVEQILEFTNAKPDNWDDDTCNLANNEYYKNFISTNRDVKFSVDLILVSGCWSGGKESMVDWLKNLKESGADGVQLKLLSFIQGIVLCETDKSIVNLCLGMLLRLIDGHKEIAFSNLCLLFYKLGREVDPSMQKFYLFSLPKLAVKKENIPLIVGIIESLKKGWRRVMTPIVIQLYLSLWKFDSRTYSYLHKMLHDDTSADYDWELNVCKAIALKDVCRLAPHLHAKDLVGVLSKILNENSGHANGLPAAIAIEAVTELCKAYVIDVSGTWNAIQPKLKADIRPKVIISLCKFFGEIPKLNSSGQKQEELMQEIVPMLWKYSLDKNSEVVKTAFQALSNFNIENLQLSLFPSIYRVNIKMPKDFEKTSKNSEDILTLPYVPGECWIQFLQKLRENVLKDGGELLVVILERELASLPRGIFYLPPEKSEPLNYSYLPQRSVCRGLIDHLQRQSIEDSIAIPLYIQEIIRVLSREYSKLLPPLDWNFLKKFMSLDSVCLNHCCALVAKQASASASAKSILDNHLKSMEWNLNALEELDFLYGLLPLLCKGVSYNVLQDFLEKTIELCLRATLNNGTSHFHRILESLAETLRSKAVQSSHKNLIVKQLERVLISIPSDHEVMKNYALCATEFPVKSIERMTSVKELKEVDSHWLRRAVAIRCAIAMRSDIKNPLVWLNEFTEAAANFPKEQAFILETIWSIIRNRRSCHHSTWIQELTWRIQASITTSGEEEPSEVTSLFLIEVFLSAAIVLSGDDCLFADVNEFTINRRKKLEMFPHSLCVLLDSPDYSHILPTVAAWLLKLSKWKSLPPEIGIVFARALLNLRTVKTFADESALAYLYNSYKLDE